MKQIVLVTGCAGYVGSMVTQELLHRGLAVRGFDMLRYSGQSLLGVWSNPDFEFVRGDVRDRPAVQQALRGAKHIVHLAAIVGDPACARDPEAAKSTNLDASLQLIELAEQANIDRFVFASTCSNYGKMENASGYVDETSPLRPVSLYAETKVAVEKEMLSRKNAGPSYTCLRFATVYGASPRMRFDLTVNQFAMEMEVKKKVVVYGEQFWRPYIHVRDMARAVGEVICTDRKIVQGEVFNVGCTKENYTKQNIVEIIQRLNPGGEVEYVHKDEDPRDYRVSFEKIASKLNFKITKKVEDGVREVTQLVQDGIITDPELPIYGN